MTRPADSGDSEQKRIVVGNICGIYGVSGWVKIISFTRPRENIFLYRPWLVAQGSDWQTMELLEGKPQAKGLIARLEGLHDRDDARKLIGHEIAVYRSQMPELPEGEYYWCDLIQMQVVNMDGNSLGLVTEVQETGANDVLVITGEKRHLIPLIFDRYVISIDQEQARIVVDWDLRN